MVLVHDDDLERINVMVEGTVSGHVIGDYLASLMLVLVINHDVDAPTRHVDGSFQEVQHRDL
jgi:hypothetical protein